jgi:transposase InsO family protein
MRHNWQQIKNDYVLASSEKLRPTLEQLAAKYNCSPSHLREKAAKENWKVEAERYLETVQTKRKEHKSEALAGSLAEWDARVFNAAGTALELVDSRLNSVTEEPLSANQIDLLTKSLERIQKIGKAALGEEQKLNVNIDYSNLSDEQLQRLAAGEDPRHVVA